VRAETRRRAWRRNWRAKARRAKVSFELLFAGEGALRELTRLIPSFLIVSISDPNIVFQSEMVAGGSKGKRKASSNQTERFSFLLLPLPFVR